MQEVYHDGSKGKIKKFNSLEEMLPELKKSLENENVKYIKIFKIREEGKVAKEEVNKDLLDVLEEAKKEK